MIRVTRTSTMAVRFYTAIFILLSLAASCLSDPVQNSDTVFKRQTGGDEDQEETPIETRVDLLYQIYQATQNNMIQLNTEISLFNEQLANLRDTQTKSETETQNNLSKQNQQLISEIKSLKMDLHTLEEQLISSENTTNANISKLFNHIQDSLNSVENTTEKQIGKMLELQTEAQANRSRLAYRLNAKVDAVEGQTIKQLSSLQSSVNTLNTTTMAQLSSLQSSVNSLTTRVNYPVNLYQNCIQETRSCMKPALGPTWVTFCTTNSLPAHITVSFMSFSFQLYANV